MQKTVSTFRIESNYALVQSTYWISSLMFSGFTAILLGSMGMKDGQIGLTSSLIGLAAIALQLLIAGYADLHASVPIKHIVAGVYLAAILAGALMYAFPLSGVALMLIYTLGCAFLTTNIGLLNAQIIQYANAGLQVNYGWPRGVSSIVYASLAFVMGIVLKTSPPSLLLPLFLIAASLAVGSVLLMPPVPGVSRRRAAFGQEKASEHVSYRSLILGNKPFRLFLLASVVLYASQSPAFLFLVRIVENAGGTSEALGISMFLQFGLEMPAMFLMPLMLKKVAAHKLLVFSFICYTIKALLLATANSLTMLYAAMAISVFCFGVYGIASVHFVNGLTASGAKVRAQGLMALCSSAGGIIGNFTAGLLIDRFGLSMMLSIGLGVMALGLALMAACAKAYAKENSA